jgi:hypothetical protein
MSDAHAVARREIENLKPEIAGQVYEQVCVNIRATDENSFRLLSLVPLVSGGGIAILLSSSTSFDRLPLVVFVSLFGALVTFGLYRWELRNIQTCSRLIRLGAGLERELFEIGSSGQFSGRRNEPAPAIYAGKIPAPKLLRRKVGKTEAERIIYWTVIIGWLLLPGVSTLLAALNN